MKSFFLEKIFCGTDFHIGCARIRSEIARQHGKQAVGTEMVFIHAPGEGGFQKFMGGQVRLHVMGINTEGDGQLPHHAFAVALGENDVFPPVRGETQDGFSADAVGDQGFGV